MLAQSCSFWLKHSCLMPSISRFVLKNYTTGKDTTCDASDKAVVHACGGRPAGKTSSGIHDASGGNTANRVTTCGDNQDVPVHVNVQCSAGKICTVSHDASEGYSTCKATTSVSNDKAVVHVCVGCLAGKTSTGIHVESGGNTNARQLCAVPMRRLQSISVRNALPERQSQVAMMRLEIKLHARPLCT